MNKKGFTLIELIAVLIILTVITAMIMPNIVKYIDKNREESALSIEKLLIHNLELYNTDKEKDLWNDLPSGMRGNFWSGNSKPRVQWKSFGF